ncbi:MAG: LysM domain-containing protein [Chloroflexota bacterium]
MDTRKSFIMLMILTSLLFVTGCREEQEPQDGTVTPPVIPVGTDTAGGSGNGTGAYPVPGDTVPTPTISGGGVIIMPEATPGVSPTAEAPVDNGQTSGELAPVVPIIAESDVTAEPLPSATVYASPSDSSGDSGYTSGSTIQHTVIEGDWLLQIAKCYGTTFAAIRDANYLPYPDYIVPGTVLAVPGVGTGGPVIGAPCVVEYTVQVGDTWESLAQRYDTTVETLQRVNPGPLNIGRVIFVPAITPSSVTMPSLTHHLVFNLNGDLAVWRSTDGFVEVTVNESEILDLATNETGHYVLARQTRNGGATNEIVLIDTVARISTVVETGLSPIADNSPAAVAGSLHISPDGMWAVYSVQSDNSYRLTSFQTAAPGTRYSVSDIAYPDDAMQFASSLFPGADDTSFVVADPQGLLVYPYSLDRAPLTLVAIDPASMSPVAGFVDVVPVPGGEYLLALGAFIEGGAYFAIDAQTGAYAQIPGSEGHVTIGATFAQEDGQIVVVTPTEIGAFRPSMDNVPTGNG